MMQRTVVLVIALFWSSIVFGQSLPKVRMAYTSINIQMTPIYIMKDLDLPRKHGLDAEVLMIPVSSRAIQAALAGEIQFMTSGGVANIDANMAGGEGEALMALQNKGVDAATISDPFTTIGQARVSALSPISAG